MFAKRVEAMSDKDAEKAYAAMGDDDFGKKSILAVRTRRMDSFQRGWLTVEA